MAQSSLIGSILERKPVSKPSVPLATTSTGFPAVQHRSQSAFARARGQSQKRVREVPVVQVPSNTTPSDFIGASTSDEPDDWRAHIEEENRRRVEIMTEDEREQEKAEIIDKFGPNIADVLRRTRQAREAKQGKSEEEQVGRELSSSSIPLRSTNEGEHAGTNILSSPSPTRPRFDERTKSLTSIIRPSSPFLASASSTRPPSRTERKIRFADVTPGDIHVYESAPPSPRRKAIALPPPSDDDGPTISLGTWNPPVHFRNTVAVAPIGVDSSETNEKVGDLEEGSPEDIRRRFFPTVAANDPSLEWIQSEPEAEMESDSTNPTVRFDLTGTPIPAHLSASLPTHLGLHHHAEGSHAGYTLEDIFLLSRSTVPGQRATMLAVLARIAHRLARTSVNSKKGIPELLGQELALRKRMIAAGVEAMGERASVGARAVELLWECTAQWDEEVEWIEDVELKDLDRGEALASLPLDFVLPQIASSLSLAELPRESLSHLLDILHRLAQHSNTNATAIIATKGLIANVLQVFLITPIPPNHGSHLPNPLAVQFLRLLAASSRENATTLIDPVDSLLRFVIMVPPESPFPLTLATKLLTETLLLYTTLASYGLYAHVTTTAQEHFLQLSRYVRSSDCQSQQLRNAWLRALEAWIVCARDPHRTTPSHDILWSQVVGWGWAEDILDLRSRLTEPDEESWANLWNALAAFLEGAKVNGIQGGEEERSVVIAAVKDAFTDGTEQRVVEAAVMGGRDTLSGLTAGIHQGILASDVPLLKKLGRHANALTSAIRLFLSCLPGGANDFAEAPPFMLPFQDLFSLNAAIAARPMWSYLYSSESVPYDHLFYRPFSSVLSSYLQLSRQIPGTAVDLWMAQAFATFCRLLPGDEVTAQLTATEVAEAITRDFLQLRGWSVPEEIWERGGMNVIIPFLTHSLKPGDDLIVAPTLMTPWSIATAATLRLPPLSSLQLNGKRHYPLPLTRDWMFCPLDHLLRSGESEVFKNLPSSWSASEAEVVRATLLFTRVSQEALSYHKLESTLMSREEVAFGCMKVFMLEHGQPQNDSADEVFRDSIVERLMTDLLAPFCASASTNTLRTPAPSIHTSDSIDVVARRFLGSSVPFYQWYTDFVALYDAISFSHPLFARLLIPPLSMRYPVDYRKYLWVDYNHVMRTVRTAPGDVITASIAEYLWPVETDAEVIAAYLRALVKGPLEGFVRLVAVHHVACRIWPDLGSDGEEQARKLLMALVDQGGFEAVRDVVLYRQNRQGTIALPPECFKQQGTWRTSRLEFAESCGGGVRERLGALLEAKEE